MNTALVDLWNNIAKINGKTETAESAVKTYIIDQIAENSIMREIWKIVMLGANVIPVVHNNGKNPFVLQQGNLLPALEGVMALSNAIISISTADAAGIISSSIDVLSSVAAISGKDNLSMILKQPNIEGIPISAPSIVESRTADVSEQPLIVQSTGQKAYNTDNVVPRLKEWQIDGYITPMLSIDSSYLIKPSLDLQAEFLDMCLNSRKPVLFKTSRGKFVMVQIINLQFTEEASYNNSIKISVTLKEYNPMTIDFTEQIFESATTDINELNSNKARGGVES